MKTVREIELILENRPGQLSEVSELLGSSGINIIGFYVATSGEEGRLHFVCNDPDRSVNLLEAAGYGIQVREVLACETPHHAGGLNAVLKPLKRAGINVDYIYPCIGTGDITVLIIGLGPVEKAAEILESNWIRLLGTEVYSMG